MNPVGLSEIGKCFGVANIHRESKSSQSLCYRDLAIQNQNTYVIEYFLVAYLSPDYQPCYVP